MPNTRQNSHPRAGHPIRAFPKSLSRPSNTLLHCRMTYLICIIHRSAYSQRALFPHGITKEQIKQRLFPIAALQRSAGRSYDDGLLRRVGTPTETGRL